MKIFVAVVILALAGAVQCYNAKQDLRTTAGIINSYTTVMIPHLETDAEIDDIDNPAVETVLLGYISSLYQAQQAAVSLFDLSVQQNPSSLCPRCNWPQAKLYWADFQSLLQAYHTSPPETMEDKRARIAQAIYDEKQIAKLMRVCQYTYC